MSKRKIKIGDSITFRAVTRGGSPKLTRVVNGFWSGNPTVRAHGWPDFVVRHDEIISVTSPNPQGRPAVADVSAPRPERAEDGDVLEVQP